MSNLGQVYIYQENWLKADECLHRSQELFAEVGSEGFLPELERRWGEFCLRTDELDQALTHANRSIELAEDQEARLELGMSYRTLGEVHLNRNDYDEADTALRKSLQILTDLNSEYEAAKTMLLLIRLQLDMDLEVDREQLENAIQTFEKLGAQANLEEANTLAELLD